MSREICGNFDETDVTCESCILNKVQNHNSCYKLVKKEQKTTMQTTTNYDVAQVNHPSHYQQDGRLECLDEMLLMFGKEDVITWCRLTAYKYYYRCGNKSAVFMRGAVHVDTGAVEREVEGTGDILCTLR